MKGVWLILTWCVDVCTSFRPILSIRNNMKISCVDIHSKFNIFVGIQRLHGRYSSIMVLIYHWVSNLEKWRGKFFCWKKIIDRTSNIWEWIDTACSNLQSCSIFYSSKLHSCFNRNETDMHQICFSYLCTLRSFHWNNNAWIKIG